MRSQIDKVVRLPNSVRDSPTPHTPPIPTPTPAAANDPVGLVAARTAFIEQAERWRDVLKDAKHRKWAKAVAKYALGGEGVRFFAEDDAGKLAKIITALKNDFDANDLVLDVFDLNNTAREVHPAVNERLDLEFYRALLDKCPLEADLAKVSLREPVHQITAVYISWATRLQRMRGVSFAPDDVVSGALVATEDAGGGDVSEIDDNQRLLKQILDGEAERAEVTKQDSEHAALAFRFQQAADQGVEAFAAAVEAYGAPEVLSGEQAGGLDLSAYGFAVEGRVDTCGQSQRDLELVRLSREVDEAAARCGVSFTQVSVPPHEQVVPEPGGARAVGVQQPSGLAFTYAGGDGSDDEGTAQPGMSGEHSWGELSLLAEADGMFAASNAQQRARADAREWAVQVESLATTF
ncbi:hypothetical protein CYMTET_33308 [Cymbomonas tetramitiformis]|uniref:Uncharacterized protein n=1 Tax=Cymbomonas tetramitiformis TaxID=36881 RepID=A0AAE0KRB8_9CHLO|nr:hypothetical protein CYMTET_33308 [Cymbomonas tetramitiformis]